MIEAYWRRGNSGPEVAITEQTGEPKHQAQVQRIRFCLSVPAGKHRTTFDRQLEGGHIVLPFLWAL